MPPFNKNTPFKKWGSKVPTPGSGVITPSGAGINTKGQVLGSGRYPGALGLQGQAAGSGNAAGATMNPAVNIGPPNPDAPETCVELRWVITPDLDGPQLQYRAWKLPPIGGYLTNHFSEWKPIPFVFKSSKLQVDPPLQKDATSEQDQRTDAASEQGRTQT